MEEGRRAVSWKNSKDKRMCVMCQGGDRSSGCGEETEGRQREREKEREVDAWRIGEMIKRTAAIMMRRLAGRTVSIQFVRISVNTVLTDVLWQAGDEAVRPCPSICAVM